MKVKLRTCYAGPQGAHKPGAVIEVGEKEAAELVDGGFAELVDEPQPNVKPQQKPSKPAAKDA